MIFDVNERESHVLDPLFWQKGDGHGAIRDEMERMKGAGINDFIVESRPHPDYLGEGWWSDLAFILGEAQRLDMRVWIFDDGAYPSGSANGELAKEYPQYTKRYWAESHMDASGPLPHANFLISDWLGEGDALYRVVAARRTDRGEELNSDTLTDLTHLVTGGRLYWPVPEGEWRVFVIRVTARGGEEHTASYVDSMSYEGVGKYIELVHERHYARFGDLFGTRIAGFFTDEPRFGNAMGYGRVLGGSRMPLPYTPGIEDRLAATPLGAFGRWIPLLWYPDRQGRCHDARYAYMDTVSRLFADCFTGQIGNWCRAHGVELVGHVVEENGAHSRLGYGAGHYFRAMEGLDAAGIDVVCNLFPEQVSGCFSTAFNEYDCDFSHWGLAKMAASAAKLDPKKKGRALCEAFGAYGWGEGLRLMKWITDRLAVQGVNVITPHAFSPAPFPDPDCPPHFYARGENPQFRLFHVWSRYAIRLLSQVAGARHTAPVAVAYHAEAEWGGECEPFEKAVKALAQRQIDTSVLPIDELIAPSSRVEGAVLRAGGGEYRALVVPYAQFLPAAFLEKLRRFAAAGLPVFFTRSLPQRAYFGGSAEVPDARAVDTDSLPGVLSPFADVACGEAGKDLCYGHFRRADADVYLFANQSTRRAVDTFVTFRDSRPAALYDPMEGRSSLPEQHGCRVRLRLLPWECRFVAFGAQAEGLPKEEYCPPLSPVAVFSDGWTISAASFREYPAFTLTPFTRTGDMARPSFLPDFSGTLRYERTFRADGASPLALDLGDAYEAVQVWVNGALVGEKICPPYFFEIPEKALRRGENALRIEVTNTLVKAQHGDPFARWFVQDPTGLVDPVTLYKRM